MINKAILVGNLGKDPDIRYTPSGTAVCNFSLATSESYKDKNTQQKITKTEWHRVVTFGRLAEICGEYLMQGKCIYIEGRIQTDQWEDKEGNKRYTTKIIANVMKMMPDGKRRESMGDQFPGGNDDVFPPAGADDDDIPF